MCALQPLWRLERGPSDPACAVLGRPVPAAPARFLVLPGKSQRHFGAMLQRCLPGSALQNQIFLYSLFMFRTLLKTLWSVSVCPTKSCTLEEKSCVSFTSKPLICYIVPRCHIGWLNPVELLAFAENFIHLHADSFHSVSFSWIYLRKWPPTPALCQTYSWDTKWISHNSYVRKLSSLIKASPFPTRLALAVNVQMWKGSKP